MQQKNPLHYIWVILGLLCQSALPGLASSDPLGWPAEELPASPSAPVSPLLPQADLLETDLAETAQSHLPGPVTRSNSEVNHSTHGWESRPVEPAAPGLSLVNQGFEPAVQAELPLPQTYLTTAAALALPAGPVVAPSLTLTPAPAAIAQTETTEQLLPQDPELGVVQVRSLLEDNDLGILRIREQLQIPTQAERPAPNFGFLLARMAISSSDNILLAVNDIGGLTGDTFLRPSLALAVYPPLGPQTAFIATADIGLQRYVSQSSLNYDDLRFRVGVRQGLTPRSYAQLIFGYQELFRPGANRTQFFKNTSLGLTLGRRDTFSPSLTLDSYYLIQFNGAQSTSGATLTDFSRLLQSGGAYLGYDITPQWQAGISYQLTLINYTSQERYDGFQQILAQVAYRITPAVRMSLYGGFSFGQSSALGVNFNDTFLGAAIEATIPLF